MRIWCAFLFQAASKGKAPYLSHLSVLLIYPIATMAWERLQSKGRHEVFPRVKLQGHGECQSSPSAAAQPRPCSLILPNFCLWSGSTGPLVWFLLISLSYAACLSLGPPAQALQPSWPDAVHLSALWVSSSVHLLSPHAVVLSRESKSKNHYFGASDS